MSTEELRREVLRNRRTRRPRYGVLALVLATQLVAVWLLRPRERVRVEHTRSLNVVGVPIAMTIEREVVRLANPTACPLPRTDAAFVAPGKVPEFVGRVKPSVTNAGWIAAWNDEHIYLSADAGATWHRALDGDGAVLDVGFDCFGHAIAVRASGVGVRDGDVETWKHVPLALRDVDDETTGGRAQVLGGGPDIVIVGIHPRTETWSSQLAISRDRAETWEVRDLQDYWEGATIAGRQYEDGSITAMLPISDCGGDSPWVFTYANGKVTGDYAQIDADLEIFGDQLVSAHAYQTIGGEVTAYVAPPAEPRQLTVIAGPYPIFLDETDAYRYANGRFTKLPWKLPVEASSWVADPAGRIWSIVCGTPSVATRGAAPICDCDGP